MSNPIFEASVGLDAPAATAKRSARAHSESAAIVLELHGPEIPRELLAAAEDAADNPYSCLAYSRAFEPTTCWDLRHLAVYRDDTLLGILSYYDRQATLVIVNRLIEFDDDVLGRCVHKLFEAHPRARRVTIDGVYAKEGSRRHIRTIASRVWRSAENLTMALPSSFEQYMSHFGSKTRKNLRYCDKRFQREQPGAAIAVLQREAIDESVVNGLVQLNHLRMESKGRVSGIDPRFATALHALCQSHGIACIARDQDGTILGGTLCTRVGNGLSLQIIAHDPRFNHVRLGLLCLLEAIATGIATGATVFHFLWGESDYKVLFGARPLPLLSCRYYRSSLDYLRAVDDCRKQIMQRARAYARRLRAASRQLRAAYRRSAEQ